ncbi:MAG: hypothetical protein K940chlam2_01384 [Chlamydiae bacterium]|nr:hypothetical protein [Chlamydiota bacterium]
MSFQEVLDKAFHDKKVDAKLYALMQGFYDSFQKVYEKHGEELLSHDAMFTTFLEEVIKVVDTPFPFQPFHQMVTAPIDYHRFGIEFIRTLVDPKKSFVQYEENVQKILSQLANKENVILFANHQTEIDPQLISMALEKSAPKLAQELICVAGDRVTRDPMAVPFSMGRNLLCFYSKRHVGAAPEDRAKKQQHNQRALRQLRRLLEKGGSCIWVAPSGGRDRRASTGKNDLSPLAPDRIELFRIIAKQAKTPTHFYPLALFTYYIFPPPPTVKKELGEWRNTRREGARFAFGDEIDMDHFPGDHEKERAARRASLTTYVYKLIKKYYQPLVY